MSQTLVKIVADFETQLSAAVSIGATTATIESATDSDSVSLPSGLYAFTIDGNKSTKEFFVATLSGTALSAIQSISRQGVATTGFARAHKIGASVKITDFAAIKRINDLLNGSTSFDSATNLGYDGAPTGLTGNQFATVAYVLSVVAGGTVAFDQQVVSNQTSGEALAINDIVYFKEADQRWWKADADLTTTFDQLQLAICKTTAAGAGNSITVAISGPVSGFTSLTLGSKYYLSNTAGAISSSTGTYSVFIGWALSATILLFNPLWKTIPTQKEKDAMAGTGGTPSSSNKFLTEEGRPSVRIDNYTASAPFTVTIASPGVFTLNSHGFTANTALQFTTTGALPTGLSTGTTYYVISTGLTANDFQVSTSLGGAAVNTSGTQSGVHSINYVWTKQTGAKAIRVITIGGGAGGGRTDTGNNTLTSGGGGGGGLNIRDIDVSLVGSTEIVIVGPGGAGASANNTSGVDGSNSSFGTLAKSYGGKGGTPTVGGAGGLGMGTGSLATVASVSGGAGGGTGATSSGGAGGGFGAGGGGGGGGTSNDNGGSGGSQPTLGSSISGGAGGTSGGSGTVGSSPSDVASGVSYPGAGGGGGGGSNGGGAGAAGGAGGKYGGGGGGGGNGVPSGNGGAGGGGLVTVITYF